MLIWLPLIICIVGLLMYWCFGNPHPPAQNTWQQAKLQDIGFAMFWVGLFVFLLVYAPVVLPIVRR
jgi:hypothetical protein